jgi:GrpB-like predicted nucleotidyltransferase (UPF0157 family)
MRVTVELYNPQWPQVFERIRAGLEDALSNVTIRRIEHVGSTAVPGLAAKPVIDVDVVVPAPSLDAAIAALEQAGYRHLGDMGIPNRHAFDAPGGPRRNVYVTIDGSLALRNHLAVRDLLRSDARARHEYQALKLRLADQDWESIDGYVAAKSAFLQKILQRSGFTESELGSIDEVNQG